ncbi:hypothetical protein EDEG_03474 [Edhazardia aedis USNM 41457]|uniref:Uncharacterized protein n=1 Tax=Edhazardia aedis (strain USNM 41457) TaxID=1003232 RepID=J9DL45_EDHAE|nr:hypothetical protein EDEG_03474 [Edhazardia aedis USNM 41457]|eukprot:EJW02072.1 hypothetical protein EDEG_03474 [Edhazardia aedis USNM 41457]
MNQNNSEKSKKQILIIIAASISVIILLTSGFVVWGWMHIKNVEKSANKAYCAFDKIVQSESNFSTNCSKEITTSGFLLIRNMPNTNIHDFWYRKKFLNISTYEEHKNFYNSMLEKQHYNSHEVFGFELAVDNVIRTNLRHGIFMNSVKVSSDIKIESFNHNKGIGHRIFRLFANRLNQFESVYEKICNLLVDMFNNSHSSRKCISIAFFVDDFELQIITITSIAVSCGNLRRELELKSYFYSIRNDKGGAKMFNVLQAAIYHMEKAINQKI